MLLVFCAYTVLIIFLNICADVSTNLINPSDLPNLTEDDIKDRIYGSKCVLIVESMMCCVQWGTKACLLVLYYRLTENLRQRLFVKIGAGYCLTTFVVMMGLYYGYWCRPFSAFWQTPTPNIQCATQTHHLIVNLTFNLTSDLLIIFIPLPMFMKAHLEFRKKLLLVFPFSLGFFTMVCAILSKNLSFTQPFSPEWLFWYTREASTAMIVSNMPYSWAIIRRVFRLKSFLHSRSNSYGGEGPTDATRHPSAATVHGTYGSQNKSSSDKKSKAWKLFDRERTHQDRQQSTTESTRPISRNANSFAMTDWKEEQEPKSDPLSSSSSEGSKSLTSNIQPATAIHDVDRLYKLDDDDDFVQSISRNPPTRCYEP